MIMDPWYLAHPAETVFALLVAFAVMAGLDYVLSVRLGWEMEPKRTVAGYVAGLSPAGALVVVAGPRVAAVLAGVALVVGLGTVLYIGHEEPEKPDWEKYMPEGGEFDGS